MKISIVIPNWNGAEKLQRNLPRVLKATKFSQVEEIIMSDDASTDDSLKIVKSQFKEVVVLESKIERNLGFSSNVDKGAREAKGDLIVLFNTDAAPSKDFLKPILSHFDDPKVFSVGCNTGGLWATATFHDGFFWHDQARKTSTCEAKAHITLWVSGGSGVFRKSLWDEMGGLDTLYDPFYLEDLDLGYRAWKRGYINLWEPKSLVEHYKEPGVIETNYSQKIVSQTAERNLLIFTWKNITSQKLISDHQKTLVLRLLKHPGYSKIFLSALKRLPQILSKRKIEKAQAKLTDEEVFSIFNQTQV
ncbi:MAG: Glycosyl transferase, family 2 [Candidatus Daviesbacteria bacterium GW2011_GWA2_40_9]|uniref:Glycosyl transferase, family 2 n=1 Tax=Candidatus Daviesbacteria bacterium GW2011_GWA2_40_9 TaxID=1618424 RepID=A0A0G0U722_9BACT|nr:MAG: Glycosyl transferase, family 2 [Candidatus Daviesbacteria bacterium GW2011_GWA2_40_9]